MSFDLTELPRSFTEIDVTEEDVKEELVLKRGCILGIKSEKEQFVIYTAMGKFTLSVDPHRILEILVNEDAESEKQSIHRIQKVYQDMMKDIKSEYVKELNDMQEQINDLKNSIKKT